MADKTARVFDVNSSQAFPVLYKDIGGGNYVPAIILTDGTNQPAIVEGDHTGVFGIRVFGGPTDPISDIPVMIDFAHHQVHEGEAHEYCYIATVALDGTIIFRVNTPTVSPTIRSPHIVFEVISTAETELYLYEDMTYNAGNGGTLQTSYNRNRNSLTAAGTKIYLTPTPATNGTQIWIGLTGASRSAGTDRSLSEWDLKITTDYQFKVISKANGNKILIRMNWYEDLGV